MAFTLRRGLALAGFNVQGDIGPYTCYTARDGRWVVFDKAPPQAPASYVQLHQRNRWRLAAKAWNQLTENNKANWELATQKLRLQLTGYNLWIYFQTTGDAATIRTVARQSGVDLLEMTGTQ